MYNSLILLLGISLLFLFINNRVLKLTPSIGMLILGILQSLNILFVKRFFPAFYDSLPHYIEELDFNYLLMHMILPLLLFAGAIHINISEFLKQKLSIFTFAVFSTLISTFLIGYLSYYVFGLIGIDIPLIYCLLFGALISPTDPIAVLSIFNSYNVKKSLSVKVEGESLFNDGVGIVIFITIFGVITSNKSSIDLSETLLLFLREAGGGIAFGVAIGLFGMFVLRFITDAKHAIYTTIFIASFNYFIAEYLEVSGALAMVTAGLLIGDWLHTKAKPDVKVFTSTAWGIIDDILNVMLFVLMGFSIINIDSSVVNYTAGIIAVVIVLVSRFISVSIPYSLIGIEKIKTRFIPGLKEITVLTWSGLRGALAYALSLTLINEPNGHFIIYITYVIVAFSIIVQGLTIGKLVKWLKIA